MGRIIGYQYDDNVQDGDAWIGSEDGGGRTKQYTAEAVANYLNIQGKISIVGQMTYKYVVTPLSGVGTFAVFGGGTDPVVARDRNAQRPHRARDSDIHCFLDRYAGATSGGRPQQPRYALALLKSSLIPRPQNWSPTAVATQDRGPETPQPANLF